MPYIGVSPQFGVRKKHTYTATAGQTSFSGAGSEGVTLSYKDSNYVDVYQNGVKLGDADYTSTSGTAIVLATGATANDLVEIIVFDAFSAADTVSKADGGTFDGAVTFGGGVSGDITNVSGDMTIDVAGDIILDADGGDVNFKDGGTLYGFMAKSSNDLFIGNAIQDGDVAIRGNDGGSNISAVTFDMSASGDATFNNNITVTGKVFGGGLVLLQETTFTSDTGSVNFDVFDDSKYGHYLFYWICDHAPGWSVTGLRFRDSSGNINANSYHNNTSWKSSASVSTTPTHNSSNYAGQQTYAWLAGNGTSYASHGQGQISLFANGLDRALVTGFSQLINRTGTDHYDEKWTSCLNHTTDPHTDLVGFQIFGTGGNSSFGRFTVFGVERA